MKVYRCQTAGYQSARPTSDEDRLSGIAVSPLGSFKDVVFPSFYIDTLKPKRGNFFGFRTSTFIFDAVAESALGKIVELAGESYVIDVEDVGQLTFLNPLETCEEALNTDETVYRRNDGKTKYGLLERVFYPDKIVTKTGLFRIPDDRYSKQYVVTESPHQELDFYKCYHENALTGLKFELMWESSD